MPPSDTFLKTATETLVLGHKRALFAAAVAFFTPNLVKQRRGQCTVSHVGSGQGIIHCPSALDAISGRFFGACRFAGGGDKREELFKSAIIEVVRAPGWISPTALGESLTEFHGEVETATCWCGFSAQEFASASNGVMSLTAEAHSLTHLSLYR
jgi:hypothetical protein